LVPGEGITLKEQSRQVFGTCFLLTVLVISLFTSAGKAQAIAGYDFVHADLVNANKIPFRADPEIRYPADPVSISMSIPTLNDWQAGTIAFSHGLEGEWDYYLWGGFANSLIKRDNTYYLYYQGSPTYDDLCDSVAYRGIGVATSTDGIHWVKSDKNPVISWSSQGSVEEGAVSSAAWIGPDGRIYVYYGANTGAGCLVNSNARLAVSEDGEDFQDLGIVLSGSDPGTWGYGDEIFPLGAYSYQNQWFLYYTPNGVPLSRKLGVATGQNFDNFTQTTGVNDGSVASWGPVSVILADAESVLFTNPNGPSGPINVYRFDANNPSTVILHDSYTLPDCTQSSIIYESSEERWMMSCRDANANNYSIRFSASQPELTATATPTETDIPTSTTVSTETVTLTPTDSPTETDTVTPTITITETETFTPSPIITLTETGTQTFTVTATQDPTATSTETSTPTSTFTPSKTATYTQLATFTPTETRTQTPTFTPTLTATETPTTTPTIMATQTLPFTPMPSDTFTPSATLAPTETGTQTFTATATQNPTAVSTETSTPTSTLTPTETATSPSTATLTSTYTPSPTDTTTPTVTASNAPTNTLTATLTYTPPSTATSDSTQVPFPTNLAVNKPVAVSSYQDTSHTGDMAIDAIPGTYWMSKKAVAKKVLPTEWIVVDLGKMANITSIQLEWDIHYATSYVLQSSNDNLNWTTFYSTSVGDGGNDTILVSNNVGRYIRMESTAWMDSAYRNWLQEIEIMGFYATSESSPTPASTPSIEPSTSTPTQTPVQSPAVPLSVHVSDIDASIDQMGINWRGNVTVEIHDNDHHPVSNASVTGTWSGGYSGSGLCITDLTGTCVITSGKGVTGSTSMTFAVNNISYGSAEYLAENNHDPDNDSNGTFITIHKP
jgi:hypothetical protein